jgi:hypothetical protein
MFIDHTEMENLLCSSGLGFRECSKTIQNTQYETVRYQTYLAGTAIFISLLVIDQRVSAWL